MTGQRRRVDGNSGLAVGAGLGWLLLCSAVALAATPLGGEIKVNTTGDNHDFAAVSIDAAGNFTVAFESPENVAVRARRFNSAGAPLSGELLISPSGSPGQEDPSVAVNGSGATVVAWEDGASATPDDVKARLISAAGVVAAAPIPVSTTGAGDQDEPQVGIDEKGNFVVVWEGAGPGDTDGVFMRRFSLSGAPLTGEVRVNQTTAGGQGSAAVAMNAKGEFVVAWQGDDEMAGQDVFARRYTAAGAPVGGEFPVNQDVDDYAEEPGAGIDSAGNFVVAWVGYQPADPDGGAFFRLFAPGGAPTSGDIRANTTTSESQGAGDRMGTAMDPAGNVILAWEDDSLLDGGEVRARRFGPTGAPLSAELPVNTTTPGSQEDARVAATANGNFVVAWEGENALSDTDIVARRYEVPDVTPPVLTLGGRGQQKAARPVVVTASCDEACLASAAGKVKVKDGGRARAAKALKLNGQSKQLAAGQTGKLKLKLKGKDAKRLRKAVARGARATASVNVTAADEAGNGARKTRTVKLR